MKYGKLIALLLGVLVLGAWMSVTGLVNVASGVDVDELVSKADTYLEQGIYYDASELYQQAVAAEEKNYDLWLKYAVTLAKIQKPTSAVDAWQSAIALKPARPEAYEELIGFYLEQKDYEMAQEVLDSSGKVKDREQLEELSNTIRQNYKSTFGNFTQVSGWNGGYAVVSDGNGFCLSNGIDGVILRGGYSSMSAYDQETGFISVYSQEDGWFCIDKNGYKRRIPPEGVTWMGAFGNEMVPVKNEEGLYGFLDTDMNWVQECVYQNATSFKNGIAAVCKEDKWALINSDFELITEFIYDQIAIDTNGYCSAQGVVLAARNGQYSLVNKKGNVLAENVGQEVKPFYENGWAAVSQDGQWKYIDSEGNVMLEVAAKNADSFSNGLAAVSDDAEGTSWYYIDESGRRWMDSAFEWAGPMNESKEMIVKRNGFYGVIGLYQSPQ